MHSFLLTLFLFSIAWLASAQDISELERRHGFKDIQLQSAIDSVKGAKFKKDIKEKNEFDARLYTIDHPDYKKIGEVKVKEIEVKAYNGLIYEITVLADKDPRLMKALESLYGKSEYDLKNETYFWRSESLTLKYRAQGKNNIEMTYSSFVIHKLMKDDKNKKVDDIANDF